MIVFVARKREKKFKFFFVRQREKKIWFFFLVVILVFLLVFFCWCFFVGVFLLVFFVFFDCFSRVSAKKNLGLFFRDESSKAGNFCPGCQAAGAWFSHE